MITVATTSTGDDKADRERTYGSPHAQQYSRARDKPMVQIRGQPLTNPSISCIQAGSTDPSEVW
jgi:hypothetical protein